MKTGLKNGLTEKQLNQLISISGQNQPGLNNRLVCDEIAFVVLMRICRDYCYAMRLYENSKEVAEKALIEKLERFRIKYVEAV